MFACSNFLTFLSSLPVLAAAVILRYYGHTRCSTYLEVPMWVLGIFLLLVSLAGMTGLWCRVTFMLWLYQWLMFLLILVLCCFTVLMFIVMEESGSKCGTGEDTRLKQFSDWLQCRLVDESNWIGIRSCLSESKICSDPAISGGKPAVFLPIKNGCCMPPSQCGFVLKNGSIWTIPKSGLASNHHDCLMWSSKPNRLCYYCYSCKAGFLARLKNDWRKLTTFSICLVSFLIINFIIGCLACRSSRAVGLFQIRRRDQF
ncbi:hypothetical protein PVL29_018816 [Vitis rotundifolia]|uniref:Tetraspanin-8 n=1 Tax=Vitis rotundifolia TaxID=103349 RepID=A0AA38Z6L5_VITRO|nr:hypothetical protein PVL29_018816 [Vitis rotundifolia]